VEKSLVIKAPLSKNRPENEASSIGKRCKNFDQKIADRNSSVSGYMGPGETNRENQP
jgi:hypothetical protein